MQPSMPEMLQYKSLTDSQLLNIISTNKRCNKNYWLRTVKLLQQTVQLKCISISS